MSKLPHFSSSQAHCNMPPVSMLLPPLRKEPSLYAADIERTVQAFLQRTPAPADSDLQALDSEIKQVCSSKSNKNGNKSSSSAAAATSASGGGAAAGNGYSAAGGAGEGAGESDNQVGFISIYSIHIEHRMHVMEAVASTLCAANSQAVHSQNLII
jgi:hypothetical protein